MVCHEAGAAVATHVLVRNLNLQASRHDEHRIDVIANGPPSWSAVVGQVDIIRLSRHVLLPVCPGVAAPLRRPFLKHAGPKNLPTLSSPTPVGVACVA